MKERESGVGVVVREGLMEEGVLGSAFSSWEERNTHS